MFTQSDILYHKTDKQLTDHLINKEILLKMQDIKISCEKIEEAYYAKKSFENHHVTLR